MLNCWSYKTHNYCNDNNAYIFKYFSSTLREGIGKNISYKTIESTQIYTFNGNKFVTMDKMLGCIIGW